jgi:hypothetical protein
MCEKFVRFVSSSDLPPEGTAISRESAAQR